VSANDLSIYKYNIGIDPHVSLVTDKVIFPDFVFLALMGDKGLEWGISPFFNYLLSIHPRLEIGNGFLV